MTVNLTLNDKEFRKIENVAQKNWKSIQDFLSDIVHDYSEELQEYDVTKDPLYLFEGFDCDGPTDLSINHDKYLYRA